VLKDDEERYRRVRCVAAPVFDHRGQVVASIGVSGAASQMDLNRIETLKDTMISLTSRLSAELGHIEERVEQA